MFIETEALVYFIRRAHAQGDKGTINALFKVLLSRTIAFFRGKIRGFDPETRRDIQQDVMRRLIEDLLCEDDRGDFAQVAFWTYLERKTIDACRAHAAQWKNVHLAGNLIDEDEADDVLDRLVDQPSDDILEDALIAKIDVSRLPDHLRRIIVMRYVMRMTEKEIAGHIAKTDRTVRTWLVEAKERLHRT
jgi:RNA polymerase sigma factor (sigma-70 family)